MFTLAAYFLLSILSLVRAIVSNVFAMTYGAIGLTELRVAFFILNGFLYFFPPQPIMILGLRFSYPEILSFAWATSMFAAFFVSFQVNLRQLERETL